MSLTVQSTPEPTITKYAFGSFIEQRVRFKSNSNTGLAGVTIYARIGAFQATTSPPINADNTYTYSAVYPNFNGTINMFPVFGLPKGWEVASMQLIRKNNFVFEIVFRGLMTADRNQFPTGTNISNLDTLEKNNHDAVLPFDNTHPSVYNQKRYLRIQAITAGRAIESGYMDQPYLSRYLCETVNCCEELMDCITVPVEDWSYQLERGGELVSGFSAFENTKIKWRATFNPPSTPLKYWVAVYQRDSLNPNLNYIQDLRLNYSEVDGSTISAPTGSTIPSTAFVTATPFTNISGNVWEAQIEIDHNYINTGEEYRTFIVVEDTNSGEHYSCVSELIIANAPPAPVAPDFTCSSWQYDEDTTEYTNDCLINVATRQRIKVQTIIDKDSYNSAIIAAGLNGTFDSNFAGFFVSATSSFPNDMPISPDDRIDGQPFSESANTVGIRTTYRIPESWSGSTHYIVFTIKFKITIGSLVYNDYISKAVKVVTRENDEITNLFAPTAKDDEGNDLEDNEFCAATEGNINICWTEGLADDYSFIPIRRAGSSGDNWRENNSYNNTQIAGLNDPAIASNELDTSGDGESCEVVDPSELTIGVANEIGGVWIKKSGGTPPPPPVCVNRPMVVIQEALGITGGTYSLAFSYDLTATLTSPLISQVEIQANYFAQNQMGQVFNFTSSDASDLFTFSLSVSGMPNSVEIFYIFNLTLADGCTYTQTFTLLTINQTDDQDIENITLIA